MKNIILIYFILFATVVSAQNLVPNGNFETYTTCPSAFSQTTNAPPWRAYHAGTSDYFHTCATSTTVSVPTNTFGYQQPASGNAYGGGYSFSSSTSPTGYTEYLATPISPMTIGTTYEISMSISKSNLSGAACDGFGVFLYDIGPSTSIAGSSTLTLTPQVSYNSYGVISDTQNWVRVIAYFTADSAYDNIVIGKFTPPAGLTFTGTGAAYYYYDSVVVKAASGINNLYTDSMICAGDTFVVPYTLNNSALFTS
ncbi:MAG: hypothetical protein JNK00_10650, partial [Flavipsychrobacter sp.]|nr:hypothetical protein [Flavipsychrobacter sp.]